MNKQHTLLAIDPGSSMSGIVIFKDEKLIRGDNLSNEGLFAMIDMRTLFDESGILTVVYEDIRPYTSRFNMETINTCKMIGRLDHILKERRVAHTAITRNEVKSYVFKTFGEIVIPLVEAKIAKKGKVTKSGNALKPSFTYVDDRIILQAMHHRWGMGAAKSGKKNSYGIKTHAWSALAVATLYLSRFASEPET